MGSLLDTLNDGQWNLQAAPLQKGQPLHYKVEFAVRGIDGRGEKIAGFESREAALHLTYQADMRHSRRIGTQEQVLYDLLAYLRRSLCMARRPY